MTTPDPGVRHIVTAVHEYTEGRYWAACTCGDQFMGTDPDAVRDQGRPHRRAERERLKAASSEVEREAVDMG